jgi:hypothetical protein
MWGNILRRQALGEARPANTYRAARRNRWRARSEWRPWHFFKVDNPQVIYRPTRSRSGWDWRKGGRLARNVARLFGGWWG